MGKQINATFEIDVNRDVFLASFPKSGRTWLRFMVANYLNIYYGLRESVTFDNVYGFVANDQMNLDFLSRQGCGPTTFAFWADPRIPRMLMTHNENSLNVPGGLRVMWLSRDIEDVMVSYYHHRTDYARLHGEDTWEGGFSGFLRSDLFGVPAYIRHFNSWAESEALALTYETMHEHPVVVLEKAVKLAGIPFEYCTAYEAVRLSSFPNMQRLEVASGFEKADGKVDTDEQRRIRRGKVGGNEGKYNLGDWNYTQRLKSTIHPLYGELHGTCAEPGLREAS